MKPTEITGRLPFHLDTCLLDFPGEIWKEVVGYETIYSVSNLGRVRSEERYSSNNAIVREKILKIYCGEGKNRRPGVKLSVDNVKHTRGVSELVGRAFLGERPDGTVYCHKNKNKHDNRAVNIMITTMSESCVIDFKMGCKVDWGFGEAGKNAVRKHLDEVGIYENGILVRKICICCTRELSIDDFYPRQGEVSNHRRECKECTLKHEGVQNIGKLKNAIELGKSGLRYCSTCKQLKSLDHDFANVKGAYLGKSHNCNVCQKEFCDKYISEQTENIGDFYVRQYALRQYNIRIKTPDQYEKYRNEIVEKRKPKYFIDDKEFVLLRDFARYMLEVYGRPISMTEKRIYEGKTEEYCRLSEHNARSLAYTKGFIRITDTVSKKTFDFKNTSDPEILKMFGKSSITIGLKTNLPVGGKRSNYPNPCLIERIL